MRLTLLFFAILVSSLAWSQSISVYGVVVDEENGASLPSVTISVASGDVSADDDEGWKGVSVSDSEGRFRFSAHCPASVRFSFVGYKSYVLRLQSSAESPVTIRMQRDDRQLDDVSVVSHRQTDFQGIDASDALAAVDISGGIEGAVKSQMGVTSNSELSSQYRVRGGNFDENMVYVNNIEVYRPFLIRSGEQEGLSFVNPDMVESLKFSSGGFDATYSDKMSSVLDVKYKTPRQLAASARISLLGASAHLEGASPKGTYTHLTGFRYKTNQYMLGSLDTKGDYDPTFFDVQSYHTLQLGRIARFNLLGYYSGNKYHFKPSDRETTFGTLTDTRTFTIYFEGQESDKYSTGMLAGALSFSLADNQSLALNASIYRLSLYDGSNWLSTCSYILFAILALWRIRLIQC